MDLVFDHEALRRAREDRGLTQTEVSELSGIPQTTLSTYETGRSEPTIKVMRALAVVYDTDPREFIDVCFHDREVA